jgi:hypothetical protein
LLQLGGQSFNGRSHDRLLGWWWVGAFRFPPMHIRYGRFRGTTRGCVPVQKLSPKTVLGVPDALQ